MLVASAGLAGRLAAQQPVKFDHPQHSRLFLSCLTCHPGARDSTRSLWPAALGCAECHDGQVEKSVAWQPPKAATLGNLRFTHATHATALARKSSSDSAQSCETCHATAGARWMDVGRAQPTQCFNCHGLRSDAHLTAPDSACVTCHVPLARATGLTVARIANFPTPPSHEDPAFAMPGGHGRAARGVKSGGHRPPIAQSCTVCHAQEFCASCHVNIEQVKPIQALARDARSLALAPKATRPAWHGQDFSESHASLASANPATCTTCHQRTECLDCHRPNPGDGRATYHNTGYLARHPAEAYARASDCSQCHNAGYFCTTCHQQAGLVAKGPLVAGYHNGAQFFASGHGKAARQSLETCVSCHSERDCLRCHSATQGRGFNPHGPGFDASKLKSRNPQMCGACHGPNIPG
jgi:hypothetical protein